MSQWTHILGIIRYDYMAQNCWCSETDGLPECYNPEEKIKLLTTLYNENIPEGSEGPIEVSVINSNRGPIIVLSGDLRDFGNEDVQEIVNWITAVNKEICLQNDKVIDSIDVLVIRDSIISIDVENYPKYKIIFTPEKKEKWEIIEVNKKER